MKFDKENNYISNYTNEWLKEEIKRHSFEIILNKIRKKKIIEFIKKFNSQHILEVGCGLEPLFVHLDSFESFTIVEPSKIFYNYAKKRIKGKLTNKNIKIFRGYIEEIHDKLENYDFIILSSLLHEVPDPNRILQIIHKICNSNTIVHINVPNVYSVHNLLGYEIGVIKNLFEESETGKRFKRHTRFDMKLLKNMLENNGYKILESGSYFIKPFTNTQMEKLLKKKIIKIEIIEGLEKIIKYFPNFGAEIYANVKKR